MLRKNLLVYSLVVFFVLALGACAKKDTAGTGDTDADATETTTETPPVEDTTEEMTEGDTEVEPQKIPVLGDVFFAFDKYNLSSEAKRQLEDNGRQLRNGSSTSITIEGHCDERGTVAYNLALGERRAKAAKDYLVSLGVSASRIRTISFGEERPFDNGHNEAAWAKNRRGHFVIAN